MIWLESLLLYLLAMMIQTETRPHHFSGPQLLSGLLWSAALAWHDAGARLGAATLPALPGLTS